jgi:hypothetical protein
MVYVLSVQACSLRDTKNILFNTHNEWVNVCYFGSTHTAVYGIAPFTFLSETIREKPLRYEAVIYIPKNTLVNKEDIRYNETEYQVQNYYYMINPRYGKCLEPAYQEKYNKYSIQELIDKITEEEEKTRRNAVYYLKEDWTLVLGRSP